MVEKDLDQRAVREFCMVVIIASLAVLLLAYANGANDNFKGVATLYGSGAMSYKKALAWATAATVAGGGASIFLAKGLVAAFSGKGLVPESVVGSGAFPLAVVFGAGITVLLATKLGFPISTTHALTGGLVGAGVLASPVGIDAARLGSTYFVPLLVSPFAALVLAAGVYPVLRAARVRSGATRDSCLCVGESASAVPALANGQQAMAASLLPIEVSTGASLVACAEASSGAVAGIAAGQALDRLHYLSGGVVSFARALNDTPKIAAVLVAGSTLAPSVSMSLVVVFMGIGGLLHSRRVADTMALRVTTMSPGQGLTANLVTGLLVVGASRFGLPVSTTHVACGSLFGIGTVTRQAKWRTIASILAAWITTLPVAALASALVFVCLRLLLAEG